MSVHNLIFRCSLKCYYDEKYCSHSLSILIFLTTISHLNCLPLPGSVPVEFY